MMYTFTPKRNVKSAAIVSLALFVVSLVLFYLSQSSAFAAPALIQLIATVCAAVSIFILSKFIIMKYVYTISENEDGTADLLVTEVSGKKNTTLCRVSLSDAVAFVKLSDGKLAEDERAKCEKVHNFCLDLFPKETYALIISDGDGRYAIKLQHDDGFAEAIKRYVINNSKDTF